MGCAGEPLKPTAARELIKRILKAGAVSWDIGDKSHFLHEMRKDGLQITDCMNVLRGGTPDPAEWNDEFEEYRYRVHTNRICVVITFLSDEELFMVTVWRKAS